MSDQCFYCPEKPVAYGLCRFHYERALDPHWQLALPYRDEQYRKDEMERSYQYRKSFSYGIKYSLADNIMDFSMRKDGMRMVLDESEIDKKTIYFLKLMLHFIRTSTKYMLEEAGR
jgi:hypothetical protein